VFSVGLGMKCTSAIYTLYGTSFIEDSNQINNPRNAKNRGIWINR
jgi:hypothetical protein